MERRSDKKPFAKKSFGQNYLIDQDYIVRIVDVLNLGNDDTVIEIGAGRGALTARLVEHAGRVFAVELDRDLSPILLEQFGKNGNFHLIEQDALKINFAEILQHRAFEISNLKSEISNLKSAKLVANLPYNISTAILQRLFEQRANFSEMILMFQREVVERITAAAGQSERGYLSVLVEAAFHAEKLFDVPPRAFRPVPKVWSSLVKLTPKPKEIGNETLFRRMVSIGFSQRRKTILNNFKGDFSDAAILFEKSGIDPSRRAETLTLKEWKRLARALESPESG